MCNNILNHAVQGNQNITQIKCKHDFLLTDKNDISSQVKEVYGDL